jgi:hypothetical protein
VVALPPSDLSSPPYGLWLYLPPSSNFKPNAFIPALDLSILICIYPNFAKAGRLQSQDVKGETVVYYRNPLTTPDLKSSGFARCFQGKQHGKIDPIFRIHRCGYPKISDVAMILGIITKY